MTVTEHEPLPAPARAAAPFEVLWADADPSGWIHYSRVVRYCEQAEVRLWQGTGSDWSAMLNDDYGFPRRHVAFDYRSPLRVGDRGVATCEVSAVGETSVSLRFTLTADGAAEPNVLASYTLVCVDMRAERPMPIPPALRALLTGRAASPA